MKTFQWVAQISLFNKAENEKVRVTLGPIL
jgi:hypothetical protein